MTCAINLRKILSGFLVFLLILIQMPILVAHAEQVSPVTNAGMPVPEITLEKAVQNQTQNAEAPLPDPNAVPGPLTSATLNSEALVLPPNAVQTISNANYFYATRHQCDFCSTPDVYDIYHKSGNLIMTLPKTLAPIQGNFMNSLTPPDVSKDGSRVIYTTLSQSFYTGHVIQDVTIRSYLVSNAQNDIPWTTLVSHDNQVVTAAEKPKDVRFALGENAIYQVTYPDGRVDLVKKGMTQIISSWKAPSNANYTFERISTRQSNNSYQHDLRLYKNGTTEIHVLSQMYTASSDSPFSLTDVSSNGKWVVFQHSAGTSQSGSQVSAGIFISPANGSIPPTFSAIGKFAKVVFGTSEILVYSGLGQGAMVTHLDNVSLRVKSYTRTWTAPSSPDFTFTDITTVSTAPGGAYKHQLQMYQTGVASVTVLSELYTQNTDTPFYLMNVSGDRYVFAHRAAKTQSGSVFEAGIFLGSTTGPNPTYSNTGIYLSAVFQTDVIKLTKSDGKVIYLDRKTLRVIATQL